MRVLLTGSSGWLGRFLAPQLRAAGHDVVGLDVAPGPDTRVLGSVADAALVDRTLDEHAVDAIVHGGALHKPDLARFGTQAFVDVNVTGTRILLDAARARGHDRFVFTSTTSVMVTRAIREERGEVAVWLDEGSPTEPRNAYGVTKLAAEGLCRVAHHEHGLSCVVLRTSRFFPEDDDTLREPSGPNLKANELLHRRLTVEDAARAHVLALERAPALGFDVVVVSAPPPFSRDEARELKDDAAAVIARHFPDAPALYAAAGWSLPRSIGRVYDPSAAEARLGFRCATAYDTVLAALRTGSPLPFAHDPTYGR